MIQSLIYELLRTNRVDLDYLLRYTNAPWLVIDAPGTETHGLFARDADGDPQILCQKTSQLVSYKTKAAVPNMVDATTDIVGTRLVSVFSLMVDSWLDPAYAPEATQGRTGVSADRVRRLAAELAQVAFEQEIELPIEWTDWKGETHQSMKGRPVSMHAMRRYIGAF